MLRNNNTWTNLNGTPIAADNAYYNQWIGSVASPVRPFGWAVDLDRTNVKFTSQDPQLTQLVRGRGIYKWSEELEATVSGGYEDNRYPFSEYAGAIYGVMNRGDHQELIFGGDSSNSGGGGIMGRSFPNRARPRRSG